VGRTGAGQDGTGSATSSAAMPIVIDAGVPFLFP
jgi:hypothetical protein